MKNKSKKKKNTKNRKIKYKKLKILTLPILTLLTVTAIIFIGYITYENMFIKNTRFIVKKINPYNSGNNKYEQSRILNKINDKIKKNKTNIFSINLLEIKKILEKEPSIKKVKVIRILPDIIEIRIIETEPQAFLGSPTSKWVINMNTTVVPYVDCIEKKMPYITGFSKNIKKISSGEKLIELKPTINLLNKLKNNYPEIIVKKIDIARISDCFVIFIEMGDYRVILPHKNLDLKLRQLYSVLDKIKDIKSSKKIINLQYDKVLWQPSL